MSQVDYDGPNDFVHLHCHTVFSTLDGAQTPEEVFNKCKDEGWPAIAITEHGNLSSVPDNYFASKSCGVKYFPACELHYNDYEPLRREMIEDGHTMHGIKQKDPELHRKLSRNRHLTVICKNDVGFHNLVKLTTEAWEWGFYGRPRVWFDKLAEYSEGLIVLSGCMNGPVSHELLNKRIRSEDGRGALDYVDKFRELFGEDYYIEVQMPVIREDDKDDRRAFWLLLNIADKYGIMPVLTNDAHYLDRKSFEIQKLMMAISQNVTVDSPDLFHVNSDEQFLKTRAQLYETFIEKGYSENATRDQFERSCDNTLHVAEKCEPFQPDLDPKIPSEPDDADKLKKLVAGELIKRGLHKDKRKFVIDNNEVTYLDQVKIELDRFIEKGFASYFLITRDLIQYSLKNGWPIGPRGSVGGSLVCYLLGISGIDPMKWKLSFDRFLSPSRGGYMLDIRAK